jgi:hypothetical protein
MIVLAFGAFAISVKNIPFMTTAMAFPVVFGTWLPITLGAVSFRKGIKHWVSFESICL